MRTFLLRILTILAVTAPISNAADGRPDLIVILADDLGWSDLACYGHPWHETPHLDRLAAEGMRFTDAYAPAPICSASRASILTGKTTARTNFEFVTKDNPGYQQIEGETLMKAPPFTLDLPLEQETVAEVLAESGYETAFMGKWHVNRHHGGYLGWSPTHGPAQQGFSTAGDEFGAHPYEWRGGKKRAGSDVKAGAFPRDALTEAAARFVAQDHEQPFFLMLSLYFVHTPVEPACAWLEEKYQALVPADAPNREKRVKYGAFIEMLDHYVGQVLEAVDENTLVVFTSDNGAHPEYAANGPLRGSKWNLYEGGIRVPFIARWPGVIEPGSESGAPVIGYDLLPTFAEFAGATAGEDVDGVSIAGVLQGKGAPPERTLLWHFPYYHPERGYDRARKGIGIDDFEVSQTRPQSALRRGRYKVVYQYETDSVELYDLRDDMGEQRDLSNESDAVDDLSRTLHEELDDSGARYPE